MVNNNKLLRYSLWGLCVSTKIILVAIILNLICLGSAISAQAQEEQKFTIALKSRTFTPQPGISQKLRDSLDVQLKEGEARHLFLQLHRHLDDKEKAVLAKQGVNLLAYIGSYTWYATVTHPQALEFTSATVIRQAPILETLRWMGKIKVEDKIEPKIRQKGVGDYNRNPDGTVDIVVIFFSDITSDNIKKLISRYGQLQKKRGKLNDVVVRISESKIEKLAAEDAVQWIEEVGPPDEIHNDGSRLTINVNPLQIFPYNLDGSNVQVGEWDGGEISDAHDDLAGRVTIVEPTGVSNHATHVAGTLGGDGSRSAALGGTVNQWRGMATAVNFFSYSFVGDDLEPEEHDGAINTHGIDISQNSWGKNCCYGEYRTRSAKYDSIVRGTYGRPIPIVFSAGNSGSGFNTVTPPGGTAKNTIVVGNIFSNAKKISGSSSRGPTNNGLIKPDVVAPGDETWSAGSPAIKSTVPTDTYADMSGTSMAAPAISGTIALMLQQYRETYFGSGLQNEAPLPSTFKAILVHNAEDLTDNPSGGADLVGPDYVYGYGLINAKKAVDTIRHKRFHEDVIQSATDEDNYTIEVAAGDDELKVTIAWDDVAGTASSADILQNDLDLLLINPSGTKFYPPYELDTTNPATPAVRNFYTSEALAEVHRDDVNVLEQVVVDSPEPGTWTIKVKTSDFPYPPQKYSIIIGEEQITFKRWSLSVHSGIAIPTGSFANDFDQGFNVLLDADYHFTPQWSLVGLFGYNAFKSKTAGVEDTYWINLSANMKYRLHTGALSPYFNGGFGYYIPKTGSSGFGINLGVGLDYDYNNFVTLELGADYHTIFDKDVQFLHSHAGVIFRF